VPEQEIFCQLLKIMVGTVRAKRKAKAIAKNKGVSFVEETSELESFFDVISMWHVWNTF
jgi:hypothetical protein